MHTTTNNTLRRLFAAAAFAGVLAAVHTVSAAGFQLNEVSSRGTAMGGALTADPGDASAVFYNPAGMVGVPGSAVSAGFTMVRPRMDIRTQNPDGSWLKSKNHIDWWPLPALFFTSQANEDWWYGVGVYVPFGLGSQFDPGWVGRYSNYDSVIESFNVNPSVAWRVSEKFSVGAGFVANFAEFQIKNKMPNTANPELGDIDFYLDGDWCVGFGGNVGVRYDILDNLQWGATYRSPIHQHLKGKVRFRLDTPTGLRDFATVDAVSGFDFPGLATTGFNWQPSERWNLGVSVGYTEWQYYDKFDVDFKAPVMGTDYVESKKDWSNVWRFALGAEWQALDWLAIRCGYVFDEEPSHEKHLDYMVPANDRHLLNCGLGFALHDGLTLDVGYTYVIIPERGTVPGRPAEGFYNTDVEGKSRVLTASLNYRF